MTANKVSLVALAVSIIALIISGVGAYETRRHNRLSVRPNLAIVPYLEGPNHRQGLYIFNEGLGPGIIKSFKVTVNGKDYEEPTPDRWRQILQQVNIDPGCFAIGWPRPDDVVKPGAELTLLVLTRAQDKKELCILEVKKMLTTVDTRLQMTYESMYEESFTYTGTGKCCPN